MEKVQREDLRNELIKFIKIKFSSRRDITCYAEDIVNDAFINLIQSKNYTSDKENFGYLSVTALRIAFSYFKKVNSSIKQLTPLNRCLNFISEDDFVKDIIKEEETKEILESLEILKKIERIIITQRYFGDLKFNEIAKRNNLNLNTVKSHHRIALEKLRGKMIKNSCFTENETHISDVNELEEEIMLNKKNIWKFKTYADRAWTLSKDLAISSTSLYGQGKGIAIVAQEIYA